MTDSPKPGDADPEDTSAESPTDPDIAQTGGTSGARHDGTGDDARAELGGARPRWTEQAGQPVSRGEHSDEADEVGARQSGAVTPGHQGPTDMLPWEGDGLADWGERPPPLRVGPDDVAGPGHQDASSPAAPGQGTASPGRYRVLVLFGVAVVAVAAISMFLGWFWGSSEGGETRPGPDASQTRSGATLASQAKALNALLDGSTTARSKVVNAVVSVRQCQSFTRSARDLRTAARQRERMVGRLRELDLSKLPDGDRMVASLSRAWTKSAEADRAFATWTERAGAPGGCPGGEPVQGSHYRQAVRASSAAGEAKTAFVRHWNPVAAKAGLPARNEDEI